MRYGMHYLHEEEIKGVVNRKDDFKIA